MTVIYIDLFHIQTCNSNIAVIVVYIIVYIIVFDDGSHNAFYTQWHKSFFVVGWSWRAWVWVSWHIPKSMVTTQLTQVCWCSNCGCAGCTNGQLDPRISISSISGVGVLTAPIFNQLLVGPKELSLRFLVSHPFGKRWVCLKIGYIPSYSHLIGIMISKTIGYNGVHNIFRHTQVKRIQIAAGTFIILGLFFHQQSYPSSLAQPLAFASNCWKGLCLVAHPT